VLRLLRLILLRHHDPHRPKSIAKPAALALHELSRAPALNAFGHELVTPGNVPDTTNAEFQD
jgi:hypothetical protein